MVTSREAAVDALLQRLLARHGGRQLFLFGAAGDPFWAARNPVESHELEALDAALHLLERLERSRPKPFFSYDGGAGFLVAALDAAEDLYFVVLDDAGPEVAEARVAIIRSELAPIASDLREEIRRFAARNALA
jgi:hypothetical protein